MLTLPLFRLGGNGSNHILDLILVGGLVEARSRESSCLQSTLSYGGTSLERKRIPLGPYRGSMPRVMRGS